MGLILNLLALLVPCIRRQSARVRRRPAFCRPQLEGLEERAVPNASTWTGSVNTNWSNAGNWNNGVPTSLTDVTLTATAPGGNIDCTNDTGGSLEIKSLTIASDYTHTLDLGGYNLKLDNGGSLIGATSSIKFTNGTGTLENAGGTLRWSGANLTTSGTGTAAQLLIDSGAIVDIPSTAVTISSYVNINNYGEFDLESTNIFKQYHPSVFSNYGTFKDTGVNSFREINGVYGDEFNNFGNFNLDIDATSVADFTNLMFVNNTKLIGTTKYHGDCKIDSGILWINQTDSSFVNLDSMEVRNDAIFTGSDRAVLELNSSPGASTINTCLKTTQLNGTTTNTGNTYVYDGYFFVYGGGTDQTYTAWLKSNLTCDAGSNTLIGDHTGSEGPTCLKVLGDVTIESNAGLELWVDGTSSGLMSSQLWVDGSDLNGNTTASFAIVNGTSFLTSLIFHGNNALGSGVSTVIAIQVGGGGITGRETGHFASISPNSLCSADAGWSDGSVLDTLKTWTGSW